MKDSLCSRGDKRTGRSEHIAAAGWRNAAYYFSLSLANEHFFFLYLHLFQCLNHVIQHLKMFKNTKWTGVEDTEQCFCQQKYKYKN